MLRDVAPVEPALEQVVGAVDEHPGKQVGQGGGVNGLHRDNIPLALVGWVSGCTVIWSALFTVGNFLYGRTPHALGLLGVFVASGLALISVVQKLWSDNGAAEAR